MKKRLLNLNWVAKIGNKRWLAWLLFISMVLGSFSSHAQTHAFHYIVNKEYIDAAGFKYIDFDTVRLQGKTAGQYVVRTERDFNPSLRGTLAFAQNANWTSTNNSFVHGYVRSHKSGSFIFPIGWGCYRPAAITCADNLKPTDAAYYNYARDNTALDNEINCLNDEMWIIQGEVSTFITLSWGTAGDAKGICCPDLSQLTIAGWDNAQNKWVKIESAVDATSLFSGATSTLTNGSITTTNSIIPNTYEFFTLACSGCPEIEITNKSLTAQCTGTTIDLTANVTVTPTVTTGTITYYHTAVASGNIISSPASYTLPAGLITIIVVVNDLGCEVSDDFTVNGKNCYTVTYDPNEGTNPPTDPTPHFEGDPVDVLPPGVLSKACSTFLGWAFAQNTTTPNFAWNGSGFVPPNPTFNITQNTTLYAIWRNDSVSPTFSFPLDITYCVGAIPMSLPSTSHNGIAGSWSPGIIAEAGAGTVQTYTFTAACAKPVVLTVRWSSCSCPEIFMGASTTEVCGTGVTVIESGFMYNYATSITITHNGAGTLVIDPNIPSAGVPFTIEYNPGASDYGKMVKIALTTNNPVGSPPCLAATDTMYLTVKPTPSISVTAPAPMCPGTTISYASLASAVEVGASIKFYEGGCLGTPVTGDTDPLSAPGITVYAQTELNGCFSECTPIDIFVTPTPTITLDPEMEMMCVGELVFKDLLASVYPSTSTVTFYEEDGTTPITDKTRMLTVEGKTYHFFVKAEYHGCESALIPVDIFIKTCVICPSAIICVNTELLFADLIATLTLGANVVFYESDGTSVIINPGRTFTTADDYYFYAQAVIDEHCVGDKVRILVRVIDTQLILTSAYAVSHPSCSGNTKGSIQVHVSGGSGSYLYSLNGGTFYLLDPTGIIPNLNAGSYFIAIQDAHPPQCSTVLSGEIQLHNTLGELSLEVESVLPSSTCNTASGNGSITLKVLNGSGSGNYWINGVHNTYASSTIVISNLPVGEYLILIKEADCYAGASVRITSGASVLALSTINKTEVTNCLLGGGEASFSVTNATGSVYYQLDNGPQVNISAPLPIQVVLSDLVSGEHRLRVFDDCGAIDSTFYITIQGSSFAFTATTTPETFNCDALPVPGTITLTVVSGTGPYSYRIDGTENWIEFSGTETTFNAMSGLYTIDVKNAAGCIYTVYRVRVDGADDIDCPYVELDLKLFLQGVTQSGNYTFKGVPQTGPNMTNHLQGTLLPVTSPYSIDPKTYTDINNPNGVANEVVDWVLVEIWETDYTPGVFAFNYTVLESRSLLLQVNGSVVDVNGALPMFDAQDENVRIVVKHRNHLAVMSATPVEFKTGMVQYDFTDVVTKAQNDVLWAPQAQMVMKDGVACLWAGDINQDGAINASDLSIYRNNFNSSLYNNSYTHSDLNMDATVDATDHAFILGRTSLFVFFNMANSRASINWKEIEKIMLKTGDVNK